MSDRPKRKSIPAATKRLIEKRQNGLCFCGCNRSILPGSPVEYDHSPALQLRPINASGDDYIPPQLDPDHIVARCPESHKRKTFGASKATTLNSDIHAIAKTKRLLGENKPKAKRSFGKGRKLQGAGFDKRFTKGFTGKVRMRKERGAS